MLFQSVGVLFVAGHAIHTPQSLRYSSAECLGSQSFPSLGHYTLPVPSHHLPEIKGVLAACRSSQSGAGECPHDCVPRDLTGWMKEKFVQFTVMR